MKTVIKYELTISKAMRSALSYGTPDEQIDEFIRYLGRHIGADRIYIFEDCPKKNITKNTYEWCADGVKPASQWTRIYIVSWLSNSDIRMKSRVFLAWIIRLILTVLVLHCFWI